MVNAARVVGPEPDDSNATPWSLRGIDVFVVARGNSGPGCQRHPEHHSRTIDVFVFAQPSSNEAWGYKQIILQLQSIYKTDCRSSPVQYTAYSLSVHHEK